MYSNILLLPLMRKLTPQTSAEIGRVVAPRIIRYGVIMGTIALIDGTLLYGYSNFLSTSNATSSLGTPFIQAGALIGLVGLIVSTTISESTIKRMREVSAQMGPVSSGVTGSSHTIGQNPATVISKLQARLRVTGLVGMVVLVIVVALMVVEANI